MPPPFEFISLLGRVLTDNYFRCRSTAIVVTQLSGPQWLILGYLRRLASL